MLKDTLRWLVVGGVIALPIILPFIVSASMFFPYITGKNFTFRIVVEILLAAWILLALLDARYRPRFSWILASLVLFVAVVGMAFLLGANPFKSFWSNFERMEGYITILHLFAYFIVASTILNTEKLWNIFWYSTLGASVLVIFTALDPVFKVLPDVTSIPRIDARFGNPIYLAVYSLFHIFIALVLMARWRGTHWHQVILGVVAFFHVIVMVLTLTRGTVLGFVGGALVTAFLIAVLERERKILRAVAIGSLLAVVAIVGTLYAIKDTDWAKDTPVINRFTQISLTSGTVNARFMNWGMAWEGVKERPVLGWGQDNYEYVFSKHYDPYMYGEEPWFDRTHNVIFDWLIAAGFAGLIAYLLLPLSVLMHLWVLNPRENRWSLRSLISIEAIRALVRKRDHTFGATERALWTGLIVAYLLHNLAVFDNIISYTLFFSLLAYIHWRVSDKREPMFGDLAVRKETVMAVVLPIVIVVTGLLVYYVNVPGIRTSQTLISALIPQQQLPNGQVVQNSPEMILEAYKRALAFDQLGRQEVREQLAQMAANMQRAENVEEGTRQAFRELALTEMQREIERNPDSARLWLFMGTLHANTGALDDAEQAFRRAVELTPRKQSAIFQLGEVRLIQGDTEEAYELFRQAFELAPEYDEARRLYALLLIRTGRDKEAVDLLTERFGTAGVDDDRLIREWANVGRYDVVADALERRVANDPTDIQQRVSLAAAYRELGRRDEAIAILEEVIAENPEYSEQLEAFIKEVRG
jgi:cytochrome c-type biogenesis protein CcmH/NrfG/O-antigen ligase